MLERPPAGDSFDCASGEGTLVRPDVELFLRWSRVPRPRATATMVHGVLEHSGRYAPLGEALTRAGISYFAFDQRGHGRSRQRRAFVDRFDDFLGDLEAVCEHVRKVEPVSPLFLVAHSMGSLITALYAAGRGDLAGIVLAAVPAEPSRRPPAPVIGAARLLARYVPRLRIDAGLDPATLSSNAEVIQATRADPLMQKRIRLRLALELLSAAEALSRRAPSIHVPTLLLQGDADPTSPEKGAVRLRDQIGAADKELVVFEGLRHELFLEPAPLRKRVFDVLIDWILRRAPG